MSNMIKNLVKIEFKIYHIVDGVKIEGAHNRITGNVSDIRGNVSGITGNVSDIRGDVSGIRGDVSGIWGNIDRCEISEEDRKKGVNISDLIE